MTDPVCDLMFYTKIDLPYAKCTNYSIHWIQFILIRREIYLIQFFHFLEF